MPYAPSKIRVTMIMAAISWLGSKKKGENLFFHKENITL